MGHVNTVTISGNLTRDPQVTYINEDEGTAIVKLGLASNRQRKNQDGEFIEETTFADIEVFGRFATLCAKKLRKTDPATISGSLKLSEWEKDGEKRSKLLIVAAQIDSPAFFRSADEDAAVVVGGGEQKAAEATEAAAPATPADDDIPF